MYTLAGNCFVFHDCLRFGGQRQCFHNIALYLRNVKMQGKKIKKESVFLTHPIIPSLANNRGEDPDVHYKQCLRKCYWVSHSLTCAGSPMVRSAIGVHKRGLGGDIYNSNGFSAGLYGCSSCSSITSNNSNDFITSSGLVAIRYT